MNKIFKLLPFCFAFCSLLSCNNKNTTHKDHLVFRYNEHKNITTLDPAFSKDLADIWATNQLFNGLVQMDDSLNVKPSIAKYWSISSDALEYTFTLRNDVYFHKHKLFGKDSTRTVTAHDFDYSFNRLLDKKVASPGRWVLNKVSHFSAINDSTFTLKLKQPFPAFLGLLSMKYCSVIPKEIANYYENDFRSHPIGTGPFKLKRWEENIKLVFRKNNNYFEKDDDGKQLPYLEAIAITFLPDKQSEFLQFIQGNIDFLNSLDASYQDELLTSKGTLRAKYASRMKMTRSPYLNTEYFAFYLESTATEIQSELLRKAINYSFDRKKMITYLRNGIGIPANGGFIPKGMPGYNAKAGYEYNPKLAKSLIEQYKAETGKTPKITLTTIGNYSNFTEYIQRELQKLGVNASVDVIPASTLKEAKANGNLDLFRASWIADYPDAENYLSLYYSKNLAPEGPNYTHYKNELFDQWYETAFLETNPKKREQLYSKMDSLVMKSAPVIPMYYDEVVRFTQKNVKGLGINAINLLNLKQVRKRN